MTLIEAVFSIYNLDKRDYYSNEYEVETKIKALDNLELITVLSQALEKKDYENKN